MAKTLVLTVKDNDYVLIDYMCNVIKKLSKDFNGIHLAGFFEPETVIIVEVTIDVLSIRNVQIKKITFIEPINTLSISAFRGDHIKADFVKRLSISYTTLKFLVSNQIEHLVIQDMTKITNMLSVKYIKRIIPYECERLGVEIKKSSYFLAESYKSEKDKNNNIMISGDCNDSVCVICLHRLTPIYELGETFINYFMNEII